MDLTHVCIKVTGTILSSVRVVRLKDESVLLGVSEGPSLVTTVASKVKLGAINELLLGKRNKLTSVDEMATFHSSGGGERPA